MSSELPILKAHEAVRAFGRAGFTALPGRGKGSHIAMASADRTRLLIIPNHGDVKREHYDI